MINPLLLILGSTCVVLSVQGSTLKYQPHAREPAAGLNVQHNGDDYRVIVNGQVWLRSAPTWFTIEGKRYSTADGTLRPTSHTVQSGWDGLGEWTETQYNYQPAGKDAVTVRTIHRQYQKIPVVLYGQQFVSGVSGSSVGDENAVCSGFPSFQVEDAAQSGRNQELGFLAYGGIMVGDIGKRIGVWNNKGTAKIASGLDSGPLVLFSKDGKDSMVISSFSQFMAASVQYKSTGGNRTATWGLMGTINEIPEGYTYWTIMYLSESGVNKAMQGWGEALRKYYNRDTSFRYSDLSNNYLGYYTDNGAYYYYHTESNMTYEETIIAVKAYADKVGLPYKYVQYDSWFYPKGPGQGVTKWDAKHKIFPDGLKALWQKTGWPVVAHNRWWSDKTVYAKQNKGQYDFIIEHDTHKAIPVEQKFWDDLMAESKEWGLITYEQDWLNVEFDKMHITVSNLTLGETWLNQMGQGALKSGLTIQYCMSPSRHALQSLHIPAVSQARASTDYQPGGDQWKIGVTSMFVHALGIAPFKDNFWTTPDQPRDPYHKREMAPALQSLVSALSTGPVAPSDKIGYSNVTIIMRACNADGLILKPSKPAMAIDKQLIQCAFAKFTGEAWSTYSDISGFRFGILLGADIKKPQSISITPTEAGFGSQFAASKMIAWNNIHQLLQFSDDHPVSFSDCSRQDFCLYYSSPVMHSNGHEVLLFGELSKWVPMSAQRVTAITMATSDIQVRLKGAVGEAVDFTYFVDQSVVRVRCVMSAAGTASLSVVGKSCQS